MSQITLNSFRNLFGKVNDGQFVISGDGDKAGLERVNRGSNFFSRHFWYPQKDLSKSGQDNFKTRDALYKLLCADNGLNSDNLNDNAVKLLRRKLGLDDNKVKYKPLQCFDVKGIVEQYTLQNSSPARKEALLSRIRDEYVDNLREEQFGCLSKTEKIAFPLVRETPLLKEKFEAHITTLKAHIDLIFTKGMDFPIDKSGDKLFKSVDTDFDKRLRLKYAHEFDDIEHKLNDLNVNEHIPEITRSNQEEVIGQLQKLIENLVSAFESAHGHAEQVEIDRATQAKVEMAQAKLDLEATNLEAHHREAEEIRSLSKITDEIELPKDVPFAKENFEALVKRLEDRVEEIFSRGMKCPMGREAKPFKSLKPDFADQLRKRYAIEFDYYKTKYQSYLETYEKPDRIDKPLQMLDCQQSVLRTLNNLVKDLAMKFWGAVVLEETNMP